MTTDQLNQLYTKYSVRIASQALNPPETEIRAINFELFTSLVNEVAHDAFNKGYTLGSEQTSQILKALI